MIINLLSGAVAQGLVWCVMAIGVYFSYKVLDFADLTVDGSFATGGAVCIMLIRANVPIWVALIVALLAGLICGMFTGLLHTALGIPPILSGILMQLGLYSINFAILDSSALKSLPNVENAITSANNLQTALIMALIVVAVIAILYWFFGTQLGCSIRATGCNEKMSRAQGINTSKTKVLGLMISNGLVAFGGAFLSLYQGSADVNMGRGAIVIGLAAVIIGGVITSKLPSNFALKMAGVVAGSIVYYLVYTVIITLGFPTAWLKLLSAVVVAIFLAIPYFKKKFAKVKIIKEPIAEGGESNA